MEDLYEVDQKKNACKSILSKGRSITLFKWLFGDEIVDAKKRKRICHEYLHSCGCMLVQYVLSHFFTVCTNYVNRRTQNLQHILSVNAFIINMHNLIIQWKTFAAGTISHPPDKNPGYIWQCTLLCQLNLLFVFYPKIYDYIFQVCVCLRPLSCTWWTKMRISDLEMHWVSHNMHEKLHYCAVIILKKTSNLEIKDSSTLLAHYWCALIGVSAF